MSGTGREGFLSEFEHHDSDVFACLRCGALVASSWTALDYDDPREKHYEWHRKPR